MKNTATIAAILTTIFFTACQKDEAAAPELNHHPNDADGVPSVISSSPLLLGGENDFSKPISLTLANQMIGSYLASVSTNTDQHEYLRSLVFNADTLRNYLENNSIKRVKFMLAHPMAYIDAGGENRYAGTRADALTMIIVGLDSSANYVFAHGNSVYDHLEPCPRHCNGSPSLTY